MDFSGMSGNAVTSRATVFNDHWVKSQINVYLQLYQVVSALTSNTRLINLLVQNLFTR